MAGEVIRAGLTRNGFTISEATIELGVSRSRLSSVLNGKTRISPALADQLAYVLGGESETWLQLQVDFDAPPPAIPAAPTFSNTWQLVLPERSSGSGRGRALAAGAGGDDDRTRSLASASVGANRASASAMTRRP